MMRSPESLSVSPERRFRYVGGHPSVDFVNTVVWTDSGLINERMPDYPALARWLNGVDLLEPPILHAIIERGVNQPTEAHSAYLQARDLRWTMRQVFLGITGGNIPEEPLARLNEYVLEAGSHRQLVADKRAACSWGWTVEKRDLLEIPAWTVVLATAELLTSPLTARLRLCAGNACGWMFVDNSRNGLRRWCEMETCGTSAKSHRRAERRKATGKKSELR